MVKCCSAIGCASRCLPNSKLKGLTFHVFPTDENVKRKWVLAMKRLDVNAAGIWEPKKGDVLCSRHFKKTDFDRSAPNIKLKPGVIPSIFDSPSHFQGKREKLHCRKNFTLKTLPVTNHNHQLVGASSCTEEFQSQFIFTVTMAAARQDSFLTPLPLVPRQKQRREETAVSSDPKPEKSVFKPPGAGSLWIMSSPSCSAFFE
ncbi:THAP domain-containing protein 6 isoform X2 [Leptonychotes weddellii]|uniref:THAP domain-containing protein 6 isoform X2 n=1 Tax=Leptonychotes weddellii TaxID=9713 RepID=A0A7F8RDJ8_LEPWE|nr:THAP domain-containing protein 6 isoform X2 [Leptonychotes weddellii]